MLSKKIKKVILIFLEKKHPNSIHQHGISHKILLHGYKCMFFYGRNSIRFNILKLYGKKIVMSKIFRVIKKRRREIHSSSSFILFKAKIAYSKGEKKKYCQCWKWLWHHQSPSTTLFFGTNAHFGIFQIRSFFIFFIESYEIQLH